MPPRNLRCSPNSVKIHGAEQTQAQETDLDTHGFAICALLQNQIANERRKASPPTMPPSATSRRPSIRRSSRLTILVDWWQEDDLQREIRRTIKQHLRARGITEKALEALTAASPILPRGDRPMTQTKTSAVA